MWTIVQSKKRVFWNQECFGLPVERFGPWMVAPQAPPCCQFCSTRLVRRPFPEPHWVRVRARTTAGRTSCPSKSKKVTVTTIVLFSRVFRLRTQKSMSDIDDRIFLMHPILHRQNKIFQKGVKFCANDERELFLLVPRWHWWWRLNHSHTKTGERETWLVFSSQPSGHRSSQMKRKFLLVFPTYHAEFLKGRR